MQNIETKPVYPAWQDPRAIALLLAASLTTMANATISPALPGLERLFASDPHGAMLTRLLVPAPSLSVTLVAPIAGLLADRYGRRSMLIGGTILFALSGMAGLVLPDLTSIFASRLVLGIAVALIMTAQTALVGDYFAGERRNAMTGLQISARNFGGLVFIAIAGWVATVSPRLPFAVYGLAAAILPLLWLVITDAPQRTAAGGMSQAEDPAAMPAWPALLAGLVILQALTNMAFFIMPTQLSFYFESRGQNAALMTGSTLGGVMLSGGIAALLYARFRRVTGQSGIFALGYAAMACGFALLPLATGIAQTLAAAGAVGIGYALVSPGFVALALTLAPEHRRGVAGGILTASIFIGQFASPLASTPLISRHGFHWLFQGNAVLLGTLAVGAAFLSAALWLRR